MGSLGPLEISLIVLVILLLFGAKKLPDLARSVGRSARIFKSEIKEMNNENDQPEGFQQAPAQQLPPAQPQAQQFQQPQNQQFPQQPNA